MQLLLIYTLLSHVCLSIITAWTIGLFTYVAKHFRNNVNTSSPPRSYNFPKSNDDGRVSQGSFQKTQDFRVQDRYYRELTRRPRRLD